MSDLEKYIDKRKIDNPEFAEEFEVGYQNFKIGLLLKQARQKAGLTQLQMAEAIGTKKTAISRLENHTSDIRLSTLEKYAKALGKKISISIL